MLTHLLLTASFTIPLLSCDPGASTATPPPSKPVEAAAPSKSAPPADAVAQKPTEKPVEKPVEKPTEKPTEKPAEKPADKPADKAVDPVVASLRTVIAGLKIDTTKAGWKTKLPAPPKQTFDKERKYTWVLATSEGEIRVKLMPEVAPMHVTSTIYLTELGFYDGLTFHRVIPGFMAQGGCPLGTGTGSPGYKYAGEFSPTARHDRPGLLSMANAGPNTDGSQFFLTFVPTPSLNDKHTIFGEISGGMETLKKLESFGTPGGPTKKPLTITKATIVVE